MEMDPIGTAAPHEGDSMQRASRTRRRRRAGDARSCLHCGRTFKRTEHLERHVRTRSFPPDSAPDFAPDSSPASQHEPI